VTTRFAGCELSIERHELRRDGQVVPMEPQVFDVLAYLVRHHDRLVPKAELLDQVWGSRFVSESALTSRIKSARRAVGDTGRDQRVIKTVHGRGYRFVADLAEGAEGQDGAGREPTGRAAAPGETPAETRVRRAVRDLSTGSGTAVQVSGPSGSGRTRLLQAAADEGRAAGLRVLAAVAPDGAGGAGGAGQLSAVLSGVALDQPQLLEALSPGCRDELTTVAAGGEAGSRQRLMVAVRELLLTAARGPGALLLLDDVDQADPDTSTALEEAVRLAPAHRLAVVVTTRAEAPAARDLEVVHLTQRPPHVAEPRTPEPPGELMAPLQDVAVLGDRFDRVEVAAATGQDTDAADRLLAEAVQRGVLKHGSDGYRFADPATAQRLVGQVPAGRRRTVLEQAAARLAEAGTRPARVADLLLAAGEPDLAVGYVVAAAPTAARAGLHDDVLRWTDAVRPHASGPDLGVVLSLRADSLAAVGDHAAVAAYRHALAAAYPGEVPGLRARMARAAVLAGDLGSAEEALAGLEPTGGPDDADILLARGMVLYHSDDLDAAEAALEAARPMALAPGAPDRLLSVITLQGMIAHNRGQWSDRLRRELRATSENPGLAATVFDSHLCVAEYLLYGPTPYDEVVALADGLREQAERAGARRGVAFAVVVAGEAALLAGDLDLARTRLAEAVDLHVALGADTGTAHTLQRLAEVELAAGNRRAAERLLGRALVLARWSPLSRHLLQRVYGTLIASAPDPKAALAVVDEAVAAMDAQLTCLFCQVMIAVPAAVACIEGGRLDEARDWLGQAERSAAAWQGTAWQGAVAEARAHLARADGDDASAERLFLSAAELFDLAGQPIDAQRSREALTD
jgi:DNA-binding winged helix-turn-helix (wHTH) protein/tetratricopeptide (TPR) repeat protein